MIMLKKSGNLCWCYPCGR